MPDIMLDNEDHGDPSVKICSINGYLVTAKKIF